MELLRRSLTIQILLFSLSATAEPNDNSFRTKHSPTLDISSPLRRNGNRVKLPNILLDVLSTDDSQNSQRIRNRMGVKFFAPPNYPKNLWRPSRRPRKLKHIADTFDDFHLNVKDPDDIHSLFDEPNDVIHSVDNFDSLNEIIDYADKISSDHTLFDVNDFLPSHPPNFDTDHKKSYSESNEFQHYNENSGEHFTENSNYPGTSFFSGEVEPSPDNHEPIHSISYTTSSFGEANSGPHPSSHEKINSDFYQSSHEEVSLNLHPSSHEDSLFGHKPTTHTAVSYRNSKENSHILHVMNNKLYRKDVPTRVVTNENDRVTGGLEHLTPGGIKGLEPEDYRFISDKTKPYVLGKAQY